MRIKCLPQVLKYIPVICIKELQTFGHWFMQTINMIAGAGMCELIPGGISLDDYSHIFVHSPLFLRVSGDEFINNSASGLELVDIKIKRQTFSIFNLQQLPRTEARKDLFVAADDSSEIVLCSANAAYI